MYGFIRMWWRSSIIASAVMLSWGPSTGMTAEIAPFRLTGIEGDLSVRYTYNEQIVGQAAGADSREARTNFEEEIFLFTHGYVYHPNMLKFDVGGGPLFVQNQFESNAGDNDDNDTLYNFIGRLSLLGNKPYPITVYHEQLNPTVTTGLAQSFIQENTKTGFNMALRQPLTPVLINIDGFRQSSEGEGFDVIIDDDIEEISARAFHSFAGGSYNQLVFRRNERESRSGNPNLPIQLSTTTSDSTELHSRYLLGERQQFRFVNFLSYLAQTPTIAEEELPTRRDIKFTPDLTWRHIDNLKSFYRYNLYDTSEGERSTTNQSATIGLARDSETGLSASADIHGEDSESDGSELLSYGASALVSYVKPFTRSSLQMSALLRYDVNDQDSEPIVSADEIITLQGTTPVPLANENIELSSVLVRDPNNLTIEYVRGVDYELDVVGSTTSIRHIATSVILGPNDNVRVDYRYRTFGTVKYTIFDQSYQINLSFLQHYNLFVHYRNADQNLQSGDPLLSLNSIENITAGGNMNVPLWQGWRVGGEVRAEDQDEDIAPFNLQSYYAYVNIPLPVYSTLDLSGKRVLVDNETSSEDVDLVRYSVRLQSRPWFRTTLSARASYEEDTGGSQDRQRWERMFGLDWRIRQLILTADGSYSRDETGDSVRERTLIRATVRREF